MKQNDIKLHAQILDTLNIYEYNLQNDINTLQQCKDSLDNPEQEQYQQQNQEELPEQTKEKFYELIDNMMLRIQEELDQIQKTYKLFQKQKILTSSDYEHFNLLKLRYNKLILQSEKIYSCTPIFSEISNLLPKKLEKPITHTVSAENRNNSQRHKDSVNRQNYQTQPNQGSHYQSQNQQYHSQYNSVNRNKNGSPNKKPPFSPSGKHIVKKLSMNFNNEDFQENHRICQRQKNQSLNKNNSKKSFTNLKVLDQQSGHRGYLEQEMYKIKNLLINTKQEIKSHNHPILNQQLYELQEQNENTKSDIRLLKADTKDIIFTISELSRMGQRIEQQNLEMQQQLQQLKNNQTNLMQLSNTTERARENQDNENYQQYLQQQQQQFKSQYGFQESRSLIPNHNIDQDQEQLLASWAQKKLHEN